MHDDRNFIDRMFLRHTVQFNVLCVNVSSLNCVVLIAFCPFLHYYIDAFCHLLNKAFVYVHVCTGQ